MSDAGKELLAKKLAEWEENTHVHEFLIPVEWCKIVASVIPGYKVTKLRCSCGEEIER